MKIYLTRSPLKTRELAQSLLNSTKSTRIFLLFGQLGTGKTEFVKGLASALHLKNKVTSPTFILLKTYTGRQSNRTLHHLDLYRLKSSQELSTLGLPELLTEKNSVLAIEWPEKLLKQEWFKKYSKNPIKVYFKHGKEEKERKITVR